MISRHQSSLHQAGQVCKDETNYLLMVVWLNQDVPQLIKYWSVKKTSGLYHILLTAYLASIQG